MFNGSAQHQAAAHVNSWAAGQRRLFFTYVTELYFRKGLGLKAEVAPVLARTYQSAVVETLKELGYEASAGSIRLKLARVFGFCYGVDRAVEYAYETRKRFADRRIFLSGEIIHNPDVNRRIREMGVQILPTSATPLSRYEDIQAGDVMILPAFGVTVAEMEHLHAKGCVLVDTTCGSVLNVWKMVHRCARDGFTVVIHGKHYHEETRATASQTRLHDGGQYLCVRNTQGSRDCLLVHPRRNSGRRGPRRPSVRRPVRRSTPNATSRASASPTRRRC